MHTCTKASKSLALLQKAVHPRHLQEGSSVPAIFGNDCVYLLTERVQVLSRVTCEPEEYMRKNLCTLIRGAVYRGTSECTIDDVCMAAVFIVRILVVNALTFSSSSGAMSMCDCRKSTCQVSVTMLQKTFKMPRDRIWRRYQPACQDNHFHISVSSPGVLQ